MWWCINYKHNSSQIQLLSLSDCSVCLVAWVGGKLSRPVYLDPHPPEYQSKIISLSRLIYSIWLCRCINYKHNSCQIQLFSLSHCSVCLVAVVGGKLSRPVYLPPHLPGYQRKIILLSLLVLNYWLWRRINYKHNSSQIQLFSLSDCSVCLVAGVGGKLSRPVYLAPHLPGYQSKIILLSLLILNCWLWRCINHKHNSSPIQQFSLSDCSVSLVSGVGGKLSRPVYLAPTHLGITVKLLC